MRPGHRIPAVIGLACVLACGVLSTPAFAAGHFIGNDSVDGREIRWEDETQYDDARKHAINAWDNSSLNKVNIAPDAWNTITDLEWRDANRTDVTWDGRWTPRTGADRIHLNVAFLKGYSKAKRRGVATHELGHALGINDHSTRGIIMCGNTQGRGSVTTPQAHDKTDYHSLWG